MRCRMPWRTAISRVGSRAACASEYGAVDLSGNVWEWVDRCEDIGDASSCFFFGGGYRQPGSTVQCGSNSAVQRLAVNIDIGFRCCSDP